MPLAAIFGLYALFASPGAMHLAQPTVLLQETQPQQPSPQPGPAQSPEQQTTPEPAKPEPQTIPEPAKPEPQTTPEQQPKPEQPTGPDSTQPPENVQPTTVPEKPDCAASKGKKRNAKRKGAAQDATGPRKKVVRNGSTADPVVQLAPSVTDQQASQQRQSTAQLLASTDANLNKISARQLTSSQQDMVNQIHNYMQQAKAAETAGDLQRARNLAFKAQLLSDEVLRH
ncbi:MAG TPA: hypothetical protein VK639_00995 [Terriglobales bacterium]|nr:hypothetical protein [Terriglobales bacterium]